MRTLAQQVSVQDPEQLKGVSRIALEPRGMGFHLWCLNLVPCVCEQLTELCDRPTPEPGQEPRCTLSKEQQPMLGQSFNSIGLWGFGSPKRSPGLIEKQEWSSEEQQVAGCESSDAWQQNCSRELRGSFLPSSSALMLWTSHPAFPSHVQSGQLSPELPNRNSAHLLRYENNCLVNQEVITEM